MLSSYTDFTGAPRPYRDADYIKRYKPSYRDISATKTTLVENVVDSVKSETARSTIASGGNLYIDGRTVNFASTIASGANLFINGTDASSVKDVPSFENEHVEIAKVANSSSESTYIVEERYCRGYFGLNNTFLGCTGGWVGGWDYKEIPR